MHAHALDMDAGYMSLLKFQWTAHRVHPWARRAGDGGSAEIVETASLL
jgi:hypothetical protein